MHTWNTLNVDSHLDWTLARNTRVAKRTVKIPKTTYDTIKYMRGWDFDEKFKTYNPFGGKHCATYARDFWNRYVGLSTNKTMINKDNRSPLGILPSDIYGFMRWENRFNRDGTY